MLDENREFVSIEARKRCRRLGGDRGDAARDFGQQPIADAMTERMIDRAEMVEIEHHNGNSAAMAFGVGD